jgi:hypothetical protein
MTVPCRRRRAIASAFFFGFRIADVAQNIVFFRLPQFRRSFVAASVPSEATQAFLVVKM